MIVSCLSVLRNEKGYLLIVVTMIGLVLGILFGYILPQLHIGQQSRAVNNLNEFRAYEAARKGIDSVRLGMKDLDNFQELIGYTINGINQGSKQFSILGDYASAHTNSFLDNNEIKVYGSSGNDGTYTVNGDAVFVDPNTIVTVDENINSNTPDGLIMSRRGILWAINELCGATVGSTNHDEYRDKDGQVQFVSGCSGIDLAGNEDGKLDVMILVSRNGVVNESKIGQPIITGGTSQWPNLTVSGVFNGNVTSKVTYTFTVSTPLPFPTPLIGCTISWDDGSGPVDIIGPPTGFQPIPDGRGLVVYFGDAFLDWFSPGDKFTVTCGDPKDDGWYFYNNGLQGLDGRPWLSLSNWPGTLPLDRFEYKDDPLRYYDFDVQETLDNATYLTNTDVKYQLFGGEWYISIGNNGARRGDYGVTQLWDYQRDVSGERPFSGQDNDGDNDPNPPIDLNDPGDLMEVFIIVRSTGITVAPGVGYASDKTSLGFVRDIYHQFPNPMRQVLEAGLNLTNTGTRRFYFRQAHNLED